MSNISAFYLKENDLQPFYRVTVKDSDGVAVDLTAATILASMIPADGGALKVNRQNCDITSATAGMFEYRWQSGDTDTPGRFYIEFEVTPSGGGKYTVPSDPRDKALVVIREDYDLI